MIEYFFILFGFLIRLIPNFFHSEIGALYSPLISIALFSGAYLSKKKSLFIPMIIMAVSDFFLGYYDWRLMAVVYGSFLMSVIIGRAFKKNFIAGSLIAPTAYFLTTNFGVWLFGGWYPMNIAGLYECFVMAIPFFKNSLIGTLGYSIIFFGAYELSKLIIWKTKKFYLSTQRQ